MPARCAASTNRSKPSGDPKREVGLVLHQVEGAVPTQDLKDDLRVTFGQRRNASLDHEWRQRLGDRDANQPAHLVGRNRERAFKLIECAFH